MVSYKQLIEEFRASQAKFRNIWNISTTMAIAVVPNNTTIMTDPSTGIGFKAQGVFLGCINGISTATWTWGWKISSFGSPYAERDVIARELTQHGRFTFGVESGHMTLTEPFHEDIIYAACVRAYDLDYVTEFRGPSSTFVIGLKNAVPFAHNDEVRERLNAALVNVEAAERDPNIMVDGLMTLNLDDDVQVQAVKLLPNLDTETANEVRNIINRLNM